MSFNGSGSFIINSTGQPVVANTVISATVFNALTSDLATGLSTCITKDGQTTITANIPFGSNKITGLGSGTAATDAANLGQVQSTAAKLITASGTDTITGTMSPALTAYAAGQLFYFIAAGTNTTSVTLNVDGLGAKSITRDGSTALAAGDIISGEMVVVCYDGTRFQMINAANSFGNATITGSLTLSGGTANGVLYLNGSKAATSGSALTFDGTNLGVGTPLAEDSVGVYAFPTGELRVKDGTEDGTSQISIYNTNTTTDSEQFFVAMNASDIDIGNKRSGAVKIFSNSIERARIDSSGNLGVGTGTASLSGRIEAQRNAFGITAAFRAYDGTNNPRLIIYGNSSGTVLQQTFSAGAGNLMFAIGGTEGAGTEIARFDSLGNFLVNATTNPNVLNTSIVVDSKANSSAGLVMQNDTTGRTSTDGSHIAIAGSTLRIVNLENAAIEFLTNNATRASITGAGSVVAGNGALTTTATDGFLYVPTCAGTPTGTPTAITGMAPIVVNTTNNKLYFYSGGSWRDAGP